KFSANMTLQIYVEAQAANITLGSGRSANKTITITKAIPKLKITGISSPIIIMPEAVINPIERVIDFTVANEGKLNATEVTFELRNASSYASLSAPTISNLARRNSSSNTIKLNLPKRFTQGEFSATLKATSTPLGKNGSLSFTLILKWPQPRLYFNRSSLNFGNLRCTENKTDLVYADEITGGYSIDIGTDIPESLKNFVSIEPSPWKISGGSSSSLKVKVKPTLDTPPGKYSGILIFRPTSETGEQLKNFNVSLSFNIPFPIMEISSDNIDFGMNQSLRSIKIKESGGYSPLSDVKIDVESIERPKELDEKLVRGWLKANPTSISRIMPSSSSNISLKPDVDPYKAVWGEYVWRVGISPKYITPKTAKVRFNLVDKEFVGAINGLKEISAPSELNNAKAFAVNFFNKKLETAHSVVISMLATTTLDTFRSINKLNEGIAAGSYEDNFETLMNGYKHTKSMEIYSTEEKEFRSQVYNTVVPYLQKKIAQNYGDFFKDATDKTQTLQEKKKFFALAFQAYRIAENPEAMDYSRGLYVKYTYDILNYTAKADFLAVKGDQLMKQEKGFFDEREVYTQAVNCYNDAHNAYVYLGDSKATEINEKLKLASNAKKKATYKLTGFFSSTSAASLAVAMWIARRKIEIKKEIKKRKIEEEIFEGK
ncbi:MAG: hypothetical protein HY929_07745, partial [Euryarchaeota archaeon]|nr:hypothetical protein [Euryarchaeota archaeon]